jgi:hypothetical protein
MKLKAIMHLLVLATGLCFSQTQCDSQPPTEAKTFTTVWKEYYKVHTLFTTVGAFTGVAGNSLQGRTNTLGSALSLGTIALAFTSLGCLFEAANIPGKPETTPKPPFYDFWS